jgi:UDP-N-acetyl-D-galactosamine dehydrogenase
MVKSLEESKIAIIGLGYVGLPLAIEFGKKYAAGGFDINSERIEELSRGEDRTKEADMAGLILAMELFRSSEGKGLCFSSDPDDLIPCNILL